MNEQGIRWEQQLSNFNKALDQLEKAVSLAGERELSDLEKRGLIHSFEFTNELSLNVMKDYFAFQGNIVIKGSRDAIREAFNVGLIEDGETWMETIRSRQSTVHTYNEETANEIARKIIEDYIPIFQTFRNKIESLRSGKQGDIFQ